MQSVTGLTNPDVFQFKSKSIINSEMPHHFCTYFDRNYLTRGLALYESLARHCQQPFVLWILCFDEETYTILTRLNLPEVRLISQNEFEANDDELLRVKAERSRVEYFWTCTPSLPLYVLRQDPEIGIITYLDADLYFYSDIEPIYNELGDGSILIIEHRFPPKYAYYAAVSGVYNVGLMVFRRDKNGFTCLNWWRERCLEWCHSYYEDGKFGDQKYLDDWPQRFPGVIVSQHRGVGNAPWNLAERHLKPGQQGLTIDGYPLIFFHFHGFKIVSTKFVEPIPQSYVLFAHQAAAIFIPYALALEQAARLAQLPYQDSFSPPISLRELCQGVLCHTYLLVKPTWLAKLLWRFNTGCPANKARIAAGFAAHANGDIRLMRRSFLAAMLHNPFLVFKLSIVSMLIKSFISNK